MSGERWRNGAAGILLLLGLWAFVSGLVLNVYAFLPWLFYEGPAAAYWRPVLSVTVPLMLGGFFSFSVAAWRWEFERSHGDGYRSRAFAVAAGMISPACGTHAARNVANRSTRAC